ncbi:MAG TPA: hypothetical protein VF258_05875 [Luteolibacter sp.]
MSRVVGLWWIAATAVFAGNFAPPAEGPVAFRRDRIPLDTDMLATFSQHLVTLAQGIDVETAANRRSVAQALALALALDPGNTKARELVAEFTTESRAANADPDQVKKSQTRIWELLDWLETPEAGDQARALASCVTDILLISDPNHPRAESLRTSLEHGAWKGWIPELAAYEPPVVKKVEPDPVPIESPIVQSGVLLAKARVLTPLWTKPGKTQWVLAPAALHMTAKMREADAEGGTKPFSLTIGSSQNAHTLSSLVSPLTRLLQKQHGSLPNGVVVNIGGNALDLSSQSGIRQSISAAVAVLASAAVSGKEPDAMIIGTVDEKGAFKLPSGFWGQLQSLGPGTGGRLILPAAAAEYLPSVLALEKPRIFLDYEILLAADFKELLELSAKTPPERLVKASSLFREIREKSGNQALGPYLANPFVRRRFAEIAQDTPFHQSAKMLAIQGAGNRPSYVTRGVLAAELRRALEPMEWIVKHDHYSFQASDLKRLDSASEACKIQLDRLARCAESHDRALLERARDLVGEIRLLDRAIRNRGEYSAVNASIGSVHDTLARDYETLAAELTREAGDSEIIPTH